MGSASPFPFRPGVRYQMGLEVEGEKGERVSYDIRDGQIRETGWRGLEKEGKQLLKRILGRTVSEAALAGRNRQYREEIAASVLPSDPLISLIVPRLPARTGRLYRDGRVGAGSDLREVGAVPG